MANSNFVVQNGLSVGNTTIFAGNGDVITSGNISVTGGGSFGGLSSNQIYQGTSNVTVTTTQVTVGVSGGSNVAIFSANSVAIPYQITSNLITANTGTLSVGGNINYGPDYGLVASFVSNIPGYAYAAIQNLNTGGNASASFTAYNNTGTSYLDMGVNGSNFNATASGFVNNSLNTANAGYAYSYGGDLVVGTWNNNGLHFITNAIQTAGDSMLIAGNGNVYISGNLTVSGNTSFVYTTTNFLTESANVVTTAYLSGNASTNSSTITLNNNIVPNGNTTINLGSGTAYYGTTYTGQLTANTVTVGGGGLQPAANAAINIGGSTAWFNTIYGTSTHAQYADLAENYVADKFYNPGTVLMFGGSQEVTIADANTTAVAGVVSTNPAHLMNGALNGSNVVPLALMGRVPCSVIGPVSKGDLMVSAGFGYAKANNSAGIGQIIGKALADFPLNAKCVIEVVVGKV